MNLQEKLEEAYNKLCRWESWQDGNGPDDEAQTINAWVLMGKLIMAEIMLDHPNPYEYMVSLISDVEVLINEETVQEGRKHECEMSKWRWLDCDECKADRVPCDIKVCVDCGHTVWPDEEGYDELEMESKLSGWSEGYAAALNDAWEAVDACHLRLDNGETLRQGGDWENAVDRALRAIEGLRGQSIKAETRGGMLE